MSKLKSINDIKTKCHHCGDVCPDESFKIEDKYFCCIGCEQIFFLLRDNNLDQYYSLQENPGISRKNKSNINYDFLDDPEVIESILDFHVDEIARVQFRLPDIHCSSCIWLLENIHKLHNGITKSTVNFLEKKAYINFNPALISLKELAILLNRIGYDPELNFAKLSENKTLEIDRSILLKIGVAGFAFGNIMLLSFPEYLGFEKAAFHFYLGYINLVLSLPVLFYSGSSYLVNAWKNIRIGKLGIHVPLAIGMVALFSRSLYEILSQTGEGYLDSFSGFVLFLLIGKWFQDYTFKSISFDRNYKSYFPISVLKKCNEKWENVSINRIEIGDIIKIKNEEIIPCDSVIISGRGNLDYSFVSGESAVNYVNKGEAVFAGGKQLGTSLEMKVEKNVDQSYLTQLWNEKVFKEDKENRSTQFLNYISTYFTITILIIAAVTFAIWNFIDISIAFKSITAVLIVACPCALALSVPFILGNASRILSKAKMYVKNVNTLENILDIDEIVFDKTGTITQSNAIQAKFIGSELNRKNKTLIYSTVNESNHPLSNAIARTLNSSDSLKPNTFRELSGKGLLAKFENEEVKIGSEEFIFGNGNFNRGTTVLIEINGKVLGHYEFENPLRKNIDQILTSLNKYKISLLSGDNESERERMKAIFPENTHFLFNQNPKDKLEYIRKQQRNDQRVMMIGDGLNDAGALRQSDVGIVISEDNNNFSPACDVIIASDKFPHFTTFIAYIKNLRFALYGAFILALIYNVIGLGFAVTGNLSPVVAAILMPTSSISIMIYGLLVSKALARKLERLSIQQK